MTLKEKLKKFEALANKGTVKPQFPSAAAAKSATGSGASLGGPGRGVGIGGRGTRQSVFGRGVMTGMAGRGAQSQRKLDS